MAENLPYRVEYAKSNRSSCRACKSSININDLRMAVLVASPHFDGRTPQWYHSNCFFTKQRPKSTGDFEHFQNIKYDDQVMIESQIKACSSMPLPTKSRKRGASKITNSGMGDFSIEYAKTSRSTCKGCELKIVKDEMRISKKDFESEKAKKFGGLPQWHHVECFVKLRESLNFFVGGNELPGFATLEKIDREVIKKYLPPITEVPEKKIKVEENKDAKTSKPNAEFEKKYAKQNRKMFQYRTVLETFPKGKLVELLEKNKQNVPSGKDRILDLLCDNMAFGRLLPCEKCKIGQYVFKSSRGAYLCTGQLDEWTNCAHENDNPNRSPFKLSDYFTKEASALKKYKSVVETRLVKALEQTATSTSSDNVDSGPKINVVKPPLYQMDIYLFKKNEQLKRAIIKLGGNVVSKIHCNIIFAIADKEDVKKMSGKMSDLQIYGVQVLPQSIIDTLENYKKCDLKVFDIITNSSICDWGTNPEVRFQNLRVQISNKSNASKSGKSMYDKSLSSNAKLKVKDGVVVDPDSNLDDCAHVYKETNGKLYNVVLSLTDLQKNKNSFYKMQLLQADYTNRYWLFRSWGRIGTTQGGQLCDQMALDVAKKTFETTYFEKTGNIWGSMEAFVKQPNKMYPVDVEYQPEAKVKGLLSSDVNVKSKLASSVQKLVAMIFNVSMMEKTMLEYELDMNKMPLGKLSKKQLQRAFSVLNELQSLIEADNKEINKITSINNQFYTLVPHNFGAGNITIINTKEMLQAKLEMLQNLLEMETAYTLMKTAQDDSDCNLVDAHYRSLKTTIQPIPTDSKEFNIVKDYVQNTHAATHSNYSLEIANVFKVEREGESRRYKPFHKLHNRKLLWHGSRISNYAGILSQGLRIAPPEAPVTGYMFGKGIYFADVVSKSANYCYTNAVNTTGLLTLCEVALGDMYECKQSEYVTKLPPKKHSLKGLGQTYPDPKKSVMLENGVEVPSGTLISVLPDEAHGYSLLYNEYIVYDVSQVNIRYLVEAKFNYNW